MSDWISHSIILFGALPDAGTGCFGTIQARLAGFDKLSLNRQAQPTSTSSATRLGISPPPPGAAEVKSQKLEADFVALVMN
jgi:hypothetical protein